MTRTGKATIPTVAATGKGDHVAGTGEHDHDTADVAAAIAAHEAKYHATTVPPVEPPPDSRPTITGVAVSAVGQTDGRISWSLSEPSTGQIQYGKTTSYGTWSTLEPKLLPSHSQVLAGLATDTTYHFRVHSKDAAGQEVISADASFKTQAATTTPPPVIEPPPAGSSTRVTSVPALLNALTDNNLSEIVLANGTYTVAAAGLQQSNSLYIGGQYAARTRPVLVRPDTIGGVTFDGSGTANGMLTFQNGAHDQRWEGFTFANCKITQTGVIVTGGWVGQAAAHHITMRNIKILASCRGAGTNSDGVLHNHGFYGSNAVGGPNNFLLEDWDIDCGTTLDSGFHFYHSESGNPCCHDFIIRRFKIKTAEAAVILWDNTLRNIVFETGTITNSTEYAITYNHPGSGIVFDNVQSTGSGIKGLDTPEGTAGLTIKANCSLQ